MHFRPYDPLHSSMVLLNPELGRRYPGTMSAFTFQYGSIKSAIASGMRRSEIFFTFQYGSIKSVARPVLYLQIQTLHSSMVLLNRGFFIGVICGTMLYIPVWFY